MVQKVQVILVDDLDGGVAEETVKFGLDGVDFEIDLSKDHAQELRDALARWVEKARKAERSKGARSGAVRRRATEGGPSATELREWGASNGYTVSKRGRISQEVRDAYAAAH